VWVMCVCMCVRVCCAPVCGECVSVDVCVFAVDFPMIGYNSLKLLSELREKMCQISGQRLFIIISLIFIKICVLIRLQFTTALNSLSCNIFTLNEGFRG
jgi:hypothetical protein